MSCSSFSTYSSCQYTAQGSMTCGDDADMKVQQSHQSQQSQPPQSAAATSKTYSMCGGGAAPNAKQEGFFSQPPAGPGEVSPFDSSSNYASWSN